MQPRLIILVLLAIGLGVGLAVRLSNKSTGVEVDTEELLADDDLALIRVKQTMLGQRPLAGEEPPEKPELQIQVEVNTTSGKNRLDFWISEAHGYYVEEFTIEFWYKTEPDMEPSESALTMQHNLQGYVLANETLRDCTEIVPAELALVGDDIGATENWGARILSHGRARAESPSPVPPLADRLPCD